MLLRTLHDPQPAPGRLVWVDGQFLPSASPLFTHAEWQGAQLLGFGIPLIAHGTTARQLPYYFASLSTQLSLAKLPFPAGLSSEVLEKAIATLLNRNRHFSTTLLLLEAYLHYERDLLGFENATTSLAISSLPSGCATYVEPERPVFLEFYKERQMPIGPAAGIRWLANPVEWYAEHYAARFGRDYGILLNAKGRVAGISGRMLYIYTPEQILVTPPVEEGAVDDPIRLMIARTAPLSKRVVAVEEHPLMPKQLLEAEQIFLASTWYGLERVVGIGNYWRYKTDVTPPLTDMLNRVYFPERVGQTQ